nr:MAG TPA: hypothetical protein [Caudoviricetes sp.]
MFCPFPCHTYILPSHESRHKITACPILQTK